MGMGRGVGSGGAMVLGKLPLIWIIVGQGPPAHAVGAGGGLDIFSLFCRFSLFCPLCGRRLEID